MASEKQIQANRLNARLSTGPRTPAGKLRSRRNACTHGLTARTVLPTCEDDAEFADFARRISSAYVCVSAIEQELLHRLTSLLWRLRRAHAVETGLLTIQAKLQRDIRIAGTEANETKDIISLLGLERADAQRPDTARDRTQLQAQARAFLRLCNINGHAFDRLTRYETSLWRQSAQVIFMLEHVRLQKPRVDLAKALFKTQKQRGSRRDHMTVPRAGFAEFPLPSRQDKCECGNSRPVLHRS